MHFQRIVASARIEFGTKSYGEASMNTICKNGEISKGSLYHYFKDKDALYLYCVKAVFESLVATLNEGKDTFDQGEKAITHYLSLRQRFFNENPYEAFIFTSTLLHPPIHLLQEIKEIKKELEAFNNAYYQKAIEHLTLKSDYTKEEAVTYFLIFQESFNHYFQNKSYENYQAFIADHELKLNKLLKIILYGMAQEEGNECFY